MTALTDTWYYSGVTGGCLLPLVVVLWWFAGRPKTGGSDAGATTTNITVAPTGPQQEAATPKPAESRPSATPSSVVGLRSQEETPSSAVSMEMTDFTDPFTLSTRDGPARASRRSGGCRTSASHGSVRGIYPL
jgi:hypothetical protein